ncbi:MAG: hydrolase [Gemmatimonadetes bacterium]|nr:MAG: hydrolase [Gemmatimonadota bacterium]
MRIYQQDCLLVVIDIQQRLFPHIHQHEELAQRSAKLIQGLKILDIPMIVTQQYTAGLGGTIEPVQNALGEIQPIEKMTFSCCGEPNVMKALHRIDRKNTLLIGIETHVCVLQTALDLIEAGYQPILIEDCVSSRNPNDKRVAIDRMRGSGVIVSTYESILFELLGVSGTDTFKQISKLVK